MGALRTLLPLLLFVAFVAVGAYFGYQIYLWSNELADQGRRKMEQKHIVITKDGVQVGVKGVSDEDYASKQQSYIVKAWNYSTLPAYKSRFWNRAEQERQKELARHAKPKPAAAPARAGPVGAGAGAASSSSGLSVPARPAAHHTSSNPGAFPD